MGTLRCQKILLLIGFSYLQACTNAVPKLSGLNIDFGSSSANQIQVLSVTASPTSGSFGTSQTVDIDVLFSDTVNLASSSAGGTPTTLPTLKLETGSIDQLATYLSGNGTNTIRFRYTVQLGDNTSDLEYFDTSSFQLNSGTISGNNSKTVVTTLPALNSSSSLSGTSNIVISGTASTVSVISVSAVSSPGTYYYSDNVDVQVVFSEAVTLTGSTISLLLETGTTDRSATYTGGSGTNTLTFRYSVQFGDTSSDLDYVSTSALTLNSSTIVGPSSKSVDLTLPLTNSASSLAGTSGIVINGIAAGNVSILSVVANPTSGTYTVGNFVDIQVIFSEAVTFATGSPTLNLETGSIDRDATFLSGNGTSTFTFRYTVGLGDTSSDLNYSSTTAFNLSTGTITGAFGKVVNMVLPSLASASSLAGTSGVVINGTPTYFSISANGTFTSTVNAFTRSQFVTIQYTGAASTATGMSMSISDTSLYNFTGGSYPGGGTCSTSLAVGSSCTVGIDFSPTATGTFITNININFVTSSTNLTNTVSLSGIAVSSLTLSLADMTSLYASGDTWNSYMKTDGSASCTVSDTKCLHSAEYKVVDVPALNATCNDLVATDSLNVFNWKCDSTNTAATGIIKFISYGFKAGKGLRDLIDGSGSGVWRTLSITITISSGPRNSQTYATTPSKTWWTNTIALLPTDSASINSLTGTNTVYFINSNRNFNGGYKILANGISIVSLSSSKLIQTGSTLSTVSDCNGAALTYDTRSAFCAYQQKNLWIEADIDGGYGTSANKVATALKFNEVSFSKVHNSNFANFSRTGISYSFPVIRMINSASNTIENLTIYNAVAGINLEKVSGPAAVANYNILKKIKIANLNTADATNAAIKLIDADNNNFYDVFISGIYNNTFDSIGIYADGADGNVFQRAFVSNVATGGYSYGVKIYNSANNNIFTQISTTAVDGAGIYFDTTTGVGIANNYIAYSNTANNYASGLQFFGRLISNNIVNSLTAIHNNDNISLYGDFTNINPSTGNQFYNIISTISSVTTGSAYVDGYFGATFSGYYIYSATNSCDIYPTAVTNITNSCTTGATVVENSNDTFNSLVGEITTDDTINAADTFGFVSDNSSLLSIADWLNFSSIYRNWGQDGFTFGASAPEASQQGSCLSTAFCRIWDWRLKQNSALHNRSFGYTSVNTSETFSNGNCTLPQLNGSQTFTMSSKIFLKYAIEIDNDPILNPSGNNNSLCESGESCIYTPNIGVFQGQDGIASGYCLTSASPVTGAKIYRYTNAYAPTPY